MKIDRNNMFAFVKVFVIEHMSEHWFHKFYGRN